MFKKDQIRLKDIHALRDQELSSLDDYDKELDWMLENNDNPVTIEYLKGLKHANALAMHSLRQTYLKIEMLPAR